MRGWIRRFLVDESGMEAVEIGVVAGLLVLIGAVIFIQIGNDSEPSLFALEKATNAIANQTGS
jgi:Flp pilus assembly pilin Flp